MKAVWKGKVLAESSDTIVVEGNHYFPIQDIDKKFFKASDTHSTCPWKGTASYYHIVVDGAQNSDAAWYYPDPSELAKGIKGHVAFWKGIEVSE